ncbi:MAG: hypothetical protein JXR84_18600 [Anaerolineae bacterium]|nr:hypothetical protein [Anaerolineae bacterium]
MAYMVMLVVSDVDQMNEILEAWKCIHVDDVIYVDSTCFHRAGARSHHIPMRFMFESLAKGRQQCSVTLFGIVADEAMVQQCITQAETVVGDLDAATNTMLVAWPLPIVKGFSAQATCQEDAQ